MRVIIGLLVAGWFIENPWIVLLVVGTILISGGLLAWVWMKHQVQLQTASTSWKRVEPHFEPWTVEQKSSEHLMLLRKIEELEHDLKEARREASVLRSAKERLERDLQSARDTQTRNNPNPLFRRVGLDENVPEWVAVAARRAYRSRLHPDVHPENRKQEAEARFKLVEEVFAQIWKLRGFQS
jgi:hypothetical protein